MAAKENTTMSEDIAKALDIEMQENFKQEFGALFDILGILTPEIVPAGNALYTYKVTGTLNSGDVDEGDEIPLSEYKVEKKFLEEIGLKKYRKLVTHEAVLKGGLENAVLRGDNKMIRDIRADIASEFFEWLNDSAGKTATGKDLQGAIAYADAVLQDELESRGDHAGRIAHFVNRFDVADYLANAQVTLQNVFGMTYLENFMGVTDVFVTSYVDEGTVIATPVENIHMYGVDFGSLNEGGADLTAIEGSLIATKHVPDDDRAGFKTIVECGMKLIAEVTNFIVAATIDAEEEPGADPDATLSALTIGSLTLSPTFDKDTTAYTTSTTNASNTVTATPTDQDATVVIKNGDTSVTSGQAATWETGENVVTIKVTNGASEKTYTVTVTKS